MARLTAGAVAGVLTVLVVLTGGLFAFTNGPNSCLSTQPGLPGSDGLVRGGTSGGWTAEQVANAHIIVAVGEQMKVPSRGQVIALATAIQESGLRNLPHGDADSLGLFQQRPSAGWGSIGQIMDPTYAATRFYQALVAVPGWQTMPLTMAAQNVQHSAFPLAYADHEAVASSLLATLSSGEIVAPSSLGAAPNALGGCATTGGDGLAAAGDVNLPAGFALPADTPPSVATAVSWALAQLGTPYSYGGDCTAPLSGDTRRQCDCSSLVQQAYAKVGIGLPRTTVEQVLVGAPVAGLDQLRPGDLIFISGSDGTPAAPGHVGLAIGQGLLIQAPHSGATVSLTRVADWSSMIAAVRRVATWEAAPPPQLGRTALR
jgi:cell wall-associated NlpC family hydrolase